MEYVDGEDLGSLLRRIGRLPGDKAIEIARKLCAGLAAAHDKGVLHRDLKPANVMIDGRGQVLIIDFGLAALSEHLDGTNPRDGTPAYMAPEQLAGKDVSVSSDVYALGLVLHEMFTGKRAFENGSERITPISVSSLVKDIDPLVERVILRCLDADPRNRPRSALAVAAALPGGDPLIAALAAGDTPTPGMVAASGDTEGISLRAAVIWLALILVGLVAVVGVGAKVNVLRQTPFQKSPEILEESARNLLQRFGYNDTPADRAYGFFIDTGSERSLDLLGNPEELRYQLAIGRPPLIQFWYRQSPQSLMPYDYFDGIVSRTDPPPITSGMVMLQLDPQGQLIQFDAVPPQVEGWWELSRAPDWPVLFTAAGLDMTCFTLSEPQWASLAISDARAAWTGRCTESKGLLRVEAASWRGRPVFFQVIWPWSRPERMRPAQAGTGRVNPVTLALCVLAAVLAWRNFRAARGDIRGATRLAALVFGVEMVQWLCTSHHVFTVAEMNLFAGGVAWAAFAAGLVWTLYLAIEPYVRRRWPHSMITWSRVLAGGFRDPLVGGHMLAGVALGIGGSCVFLLRSLALQHYGSLGFVPALDEVLDTRHVAGATLSGVIGAIGLGLGVVFLFVLLRVLLRRQWLAAAVFILLFFGLAASSVSVHPIIIALYGALFASLLLACMLYFGVLPMIVFGFVVGMLAVPMTTDLSAWYAGSAVFAVAIVLGLTVYAFHTAVAGRPLFKAGFLEPD